MRNRREHQDLDAALPYLKRLAHTWLGEDHNNGVSPDNNLLATIGRSSERRTGPISFQSTLSSNHDTPSTASIHAASERTDQPATAILEDVTVILLNRKPLSDNQAEPTHAAQILSDGISAIFLGLVTNSTTNQTAPVGSVVNYIGRTTGEANILSRFEMVIKDLMAPRDIGTTTAGIDTNPDRIGHLELHRKTCRAAWRGTDIALTVTEFRTVDLLASEPCNDISYRRIYDIVHGEGFQSGKGSNGYYPNVRSMIKRIRNKFRAIDDTFSAIENYRSFGYRWRDSDD
jgi:hypothetical protein